MQAPTYHPPEQMRRGSWAGPPVRSSDCNPIAEPMNLRPAYCPSGRHSAAPGGGSAPLPAYEPGPLSPRSGGLTALSAPFSRSHSVTHSGRRQSISAPPLPPPPPRHVFTPPVPCASRAPSDSAAIDWSHIPASGAEAGSKPGSSAGARDMSGSGVSDISCASAQMPFDYKLWVAREEQASRPSVFGDADAGRSSRQLDYSCPQSALEHGDGPDAPDSLFLSDGGGCGAACRDPLLSALPQDLLHSMSRSANKLHDVTNSVCGAV